MSNAIAMFGGSAAVPAFARKAEMSAIAKALAGGSGSQGKRISIKGGVFRLISDGKEVAKVEERYLDVVIVQAAPKVSRTFYAGTYDETKVAPPSCASADGDKPDASVKSPQSANCASCPQNVKGSGKGESRACRYNQRLAVVLANDVEGDVMQLQLAATSIFGKAEGDNRPLQDYAKYVMAQGADPTMLVTRLKFDTNAPVPKLFFKAMRWLSDDEFGIAQEKGTSPEAMKAIEATVFQQDGGTATAEPAPFTAEGRKPTAPVAQDEDDEAPAPAPKAKAATTKAKPAPVVQDDADDDEPPAPAPKKAKAAPAAEEDAPPTVRKAAKPEPAAAPAGVASVLAAWDD